MAFFGFRSEVRGFFQEHPLHFAAFLSLLAARIPVHEFIHALAYFKGVSSPRLISDHEHDAIPFAECPALRLPSPARTPDADCIQRAQGSKDRDTVRLSSKHVPDIAAPFPASHAPPQMPAICPLKLRSPFLAGMAIANLSLATGWIAAEEDGHVFAFQFQ